MFVDDRKRTKRYANKKVLLYHQKLIPNNFSVFDVFLWSVHVLGE